MLMSMCLKVLIKFPECARNGYLFRFTLSETSESEKLAAELLRLVEKDTNKLSYANLFCSHKEGMSYGAMKENRMFKILFDAIENDNYGFVPSFRKQERNDVCVALPDGLVFLISMKHVFYIPRNTSCRLVHEAQIKCFSGNGEHEEKVCKVAA